MAYNKTFETGDLSSIFIDVLGSAGAQLVQWVGIIVLIAVVGYLFARVQRLGKAF